MTIIKDLQTISRELARLVKQTEKLASSIGKSEKTKARPVATKAKARAAAKKAPAKGGKKTDTDKVLPNLYDHGSLI